MTAPPRRWRLQTLASATVAGVLLLAVLCLLASYLAFRSLIGGDAVGVSRQEASDIAYSLSAQLRGGLTEQALRAQRRFFADERIVIRTQHRVLSVGTVPAGQVVTVRSVVPDGQVSVVAPVETEAGLSLELTGISAATLLLVGAAAVGVVWIGTGRLRRTVEEASGAAERVTAGDLSARVGTRGPAELARLGAAFDAMAARLADLDAEQRQFLADVSHEIATPFHTVSGLVTALLDGTIAAGQDDPVLRDVVDKETARLSGLLHDLRELTGPQLTPDRAMVDVGALVGGLAERFSGLAAAQRIRLDIEAPSLWVHTDPQLVETILSNLMTNALRYTPAHGQVRLAVRRERRGVSVEVVDTGPGIAAEEQDRIFERFYRVDRARDRTSGGAGLGLAIARRYAQALGARIVLRSRPGHGSSFRLLLPASADAAPGPAAGRGAAPGDP